MLPVTVPASFDEVARELTVDAARAAGLPRVRLLEEPQAAFYDFEAFQAIDHALLGRHLRRLADGEEVRTARYNFKTGTSHPDGGEATHLDSGTMLLLEGIHGPNPRLPVPEEETFRLPPALGP